MTGASLVTLFAVLTDLDYFREYGHQTDAALLVFTYAAFVWGAGLFLAAPVPWAILHHYKKRSWPIAVAFGIILAFVVVLGLMTKGFNLFVVADGFSASDTVGQHGLTAGSPSRAGLKHSKLLSLAALLAPSSDLLCGELLIAVFRRPGLMQ
jgi:hypothetical protein